MNSLVLVDFTTAFSKLWPNIEQEIIYNRLQPDIYEPEQLIDYVVAESFRQLLQCRVYDHRNRSDFCKIIFNNHSAHFMQVMGEFIETQKLTFLRGGIIKIMVTERDLVIARYI